MLSARETKSSEVFLLEQFNSRSVLSIYTFDHLPSLKIFALIKSSAKNTIIGFCEVKGLYHFYRTISLDSALRFFRSKRRTGEALDKSTNRDISAKTCICFRSRHHPSKSRITVPPQLPNTKRDVNAAKKRLKDDLKTVEQLKPNKTVCKGRPCGLRVPIREARHQMLLNLRGSPESSGPSLCFTMTCLCDNGIPIPQECVNPARLDAHSSHFSVLGVSVCLPFTILLD